MASSIEKGTSGHHEGSSLSSQSREHGAGETPAAAPAKQSKIKTHLKKFWWLHLIVFLVLGLALTIALIYGVFPRIAQNGVDKARVVVNGLDIENPAAETVHLKQDYVIYANNKQYHPHLDAFNATIALEGDEPYGTITLPAVDSGDAVEGSLEQTLVITNMEAFKRYNRALIENEMISQRLSGSTKLHEMKFPATTVKFNKKVLLRGFDKLKGFNVFAFSLLKTTQPDGINSLGNVSIPNASNIKVAMGNVTFNNYVEGVHIGNTTLRDVVLTPGSNFYTTYNVVDQAAVLPLISKYPGGVLPVTIVALSSIYDGVHLSYYEYALQGQNMSTTINATAALAALTGGL